MGQRIPIWIRDILESEDEVVYLLDRDLHISECNPGWDAFAAANGGVGISRTEVQGRYVFDFIPDVLVRFYEDRYGEAQRTDGWIGFDYECSSPDVFRLFHMAIHSFANSGLLIVNSRLPNRLPLPPHNVGTADAAYASPEGILTMCAHCRRTRRQDAHDTWDWVPRFLRVSGRDISHGLCPRCVAYLYPMQRGVNQ